MTRSSTPRPGLGVLPDVKEHKKNVGVFIISSLFQLEIGRKKAITICTSKKKKKIHETLLRYRNKLGLDLLAFLLFPYPNVHFTLCPFAVGRCGAEPPTPQKQLQ